MLTYKVLRNGDTMLLLAHRGVTSCSSGGRSVTQDPDLIPTAARGAICHRSLATDCIVIKDYGSFLYGTLDRDACALKVDATFAQ